MKSCVALCAITISALLVQPVFDRATAAHYCSAQSASQRKAGEVVIEPASLTHAVLLEFVRTGSTAQLPAWAQLPAPKFTVPDFPPPVSKPRS